MTAAKHTRRDLFLYGGIGLAILIIAALASYFISSSRQVAISDAVISAPLVSLAPTAPGKLNALYVNPGDTIAANTRVALVGTEVIKSKMAGLVVEVKDTVGAQVSPSDAIVTMIDPQQLRVVGSIDENKGLSRIEVGDPVVFTVDAYGGQKFSGVVDEISPTSNQSGVVFNISNERQIQQFSVKARFDVGAYSFLKNGMSARMRVYTQH